MSSNVTNYAEERAARTPATALDELDPALMAGVSEDMAKALAAVASSGEPEMEHASADLPPIATQWARFRDLFAEAMGGSLYTVDDLERKIATGSAYFWPGRNAAVVAERVVYPSGVAVMQTLWAVGDLAEVLALAPGIEATARLVGCSEMLVEGRKGFERIMKGQGYEPWSVTLRKVL